MTSSQTFEGVMTPLFLPLDKEERIIEKDLVRHVHILVEHGVRGFLVPSGTGEFYNLTPEERSRAVKIVVQEVQGRALVVSLASDCGTRNTLRHIAAARESGADAAMVVPPYFTHVDQAALKSFFNTLANEGGLPLWLYHQPFHTKLVIEPESVRELADNPNIVGLKASAGVDLFYFQQVLRVMRDRPAFRLLMGEDIHELSGLILGGHGMVSTLSNLIPNEFVSIWAAIKKEDFTTSRKIQDRITDIELLVIGACRSWQGAAKYILKKRGVFSTTVVSSPSHGLTDRDAEKLEQMGKELALF